MQQTKLLYLDYETFCNLNIKKVGAYKYSQDPSCEVLMASYAINDGPIRLWDATKKPIPKQLEKWLKDPKVTVTAFNASFERLITNNVLKILLPIERCYCVMVHAYGMGFAGGLDMVGKAVGLPQDKQKLSIGKRLINRFCKPTPLNHLIRRYTHATHPQEWEQLKEYCRQDTDTEREILKYLEKYPLREEEWSDWFLDQKINDRGLPLDLTLIEKAIKLNELNRERLLHKLKGLTLVDNPNSNAQLLEWLQTQGVEIENMQAATIQELIDSIPAKYVLEVLLAKQQIAKSSISKYEAALRSQVAGRVYGTLQFMGASRTGRWAGRLLQIQNFVRGAMNADEAVKHVLTTIKPHTITSTALSTALRGMFKAGPKHKLVVSDLSGIEGRALPWLCYYTERLEQISEGLDTYIIAASGIYKVNYEDVTKDQRFVGKVATLALGYQGAVGAFTLMAEAYNLTMPESEMLTIVKGWRKTNQPIIKFWYATERAAKNAIRNPGKEFVSGRVSWISHKDFLFALLPSGRNLSYHLPELDREGKITYMGLNTYTRVWERIHTYAGKLCENICQAVSRDILAENLRAVEAYGFKPVGTVHDEIICESKNFKKYSHKKLGQLLATNPEWTTELPLDATSYTSERYKK